MITKGKVLVLGGTGAMGRYCVPELIRLGHKVDVYSFDNVESDNPNLTYYVANVKEEGVTERILKEGNYDAVVDFMTYGTEDFRKIYPIFLENTKQYVFLSSCRLYADNPPIKEDSPRLLETSTDEEFLATDDYALYKAREEDMLHNSGKKNWTVVCPATTFSTGRYQLVTLEAKAFVHRMRMGKTVILPEEAMDKEATLGWGGDVGVMIARLVLNEKAYGEKFIVATGEHNTWKEIAEMYKKLCGLKYITVPAKVYLEILGEPFKGRYYQLHYARLFRRISDNSKILSTLGMKQSDLMPLYDGLKMELEKTKDWDWEANDKTNKISLSMDEYLKKMGIE
ncbi:MAG: NAD-dependent epimerase/dehydratase family protein [Clostridia bacterium]|nr:NAD-dependent epimerase/dehydratase family protein [Clostridia bacterium]